MSKETVSHYLDLLEKSFVVFRVGGFSRNLRKEMTKMDKIYFWDLGIRNAVINNFAPIGLRNDTGQLWENFLMAERIKFHMNQGDFGQLLWDTILIATFGTLGAIVLAVPVAFLAARNISPLGGILRPFTLFIIVATRSINSLAWALLLVTILGPGILAGMIAISLRSIGFIAKLLYEAIEEIDPTQVEAVTAQVRKKLL